MNYISFSSSFLFSNTTEVCYIYPLIFHKKIRKNIGENLMLREFTIIASCCKMATTLLRTSANVLRRTVAYNAVRAASGSGPAIDHQKGKIGNFIQRLCKITFANFFFGLTCCCA